MEDQFDLDTRTVVTMKNDELDNYLRLNSEEIHQ